MAEERWREHEVVVGNNEHDDSGNIVKRFSEY